jgi:hypothetical protein
MKFVCPFCQTTREWTPSLMRGIRTCGAHDCRLRWANIRTRERLHRSLKPDGSGCLIWQGSKSDHGYGHITWMGRPTYVHRVMYELYVGPIADGLELDHLCRVPSCANPAHLEAVEHKVNSLRGISPRAMQARQTHCIHGHRFDRANTYLTKNGQRQCRQCKADRMRNLYRRHK